jgi:putative ABC transport system permease protein
VLSFLAGVLAALMGSAAALGAVNTMVAAVGARSREVGVLAAMGFTSRAVFVSFLVESAVIGVVGGLAGALLVLPLGGLETATLNWNTLTDVDFAFRVTPALLAKAAGLALVLGLLGGAAPAWRAARIPPTAALRRL